MGFLQVTVFNAGGRLDAQGLQSLATGRYGCQGIEEFSLTEPEVDALLGARSYSGGDLPMDVLDEVEAAMSSGDMHLKFFFASGQRSEAQAFLEEVSRSFLCEVQIQELEDQDWNAEWKKHYRPIPVGEGLVILPEWADASEHGGKTILRIHPGMGFGTGSHETTFLCLKHFLATPVPALALDYGSGSGILGLAALLRDPSSQVDFVDIDPEAHRNCRQNLELNAVDPARARLILVGRRAELLPSYQLVFANILQDILHLERDFLSDRTEPGGRLVLSGLLRGQVAETREFYLGGGSLELESEECLNDWGCLVLRKKS